MAKVSLRAYNREIETMIDSGHLDEAIASCRHILKIFPKHLETYRLLGKAYLEYKRHPEAVDIFSRVLVSVPNDFVAQVGMSIIRDEENKLDDAIWHMERAFETQPSNAAIQGELQRLYGRRDGVQPPRIRMTRGALAHMYVQGELYPQAISEIKSVLKEDGGRADMQALLARACYRSGLKNEAAEVASSVLRTYPYCLDANRVLLEILGSDRVESAQVYRQRVVELDPYAAHVTGTVFQSSEVPDAAVSLERLDWNGQPVGLQPDWGATQAISLEESGTQDAQPSWLKSVFDEPPTQPPQPVESVSDQPEAVSPFDTYTLPEPSAEPEEDIPDFLRAAGWGQSTGAFDETKSPFAYEEPETEPPIEKGELPDWVKAMAPVETEQPADGEDLPDWINKIGTEVFPASTGAGEQADWIGQLDQPIQSQPESQALDEQPDWLSQLGQPEQPEQPASLTSDEQPDWLKGFGSESETTPSGALTEGPDWTNQPAQPVQPESPSSDDQPDWIKQPGEAELPVPSASDEQPDWLKGFGNESETTPAASTEEIDWLGQLGEQTETTPSESLSEEPVAPASPASDLGFLDELNKEPEQPVPSAPESSMTETDKFGTSEEERDDSFAWLESLAARQGASEGLLTKPEERLEEEPDWVKQAKGLSPDQAPAQPPSVPQPSGDLEELGKSEQERNDSFAWLEGLAARQGASEGLLTEPEERLEQEPDWVKQARDLGAAAEQPPVPPPPVPIEEQPSSVDDTAAWLRSLDEEERPPVPSPETDATGIWLKSLDEEPVQAQSEQPAEELETEAEGSALAIPAEETEEKPSWPISVEESTEVQPTQPAEEPESELPTWMQKIEEEQPAEAAQTSAPTLPATEPSAQFDDMPEWMQYIEDKESAEESTPVVPTGDAATATREEDAAAETSEWMGSIEESIAPSPSSEVAEEKPVAESEEIPAWLSSLDEEETRAATPTAMDKDLPAWLRGEEEPPPEPLELEPTRAADWQPVDEKPTESPSELHEEPVAPVDSAMAEMSVDPIIERARDDLSRGDIPGALNTYEKLIRKTRLLDEVIHDLREALYRYPVDVSIWQSLGDAYMRANRLQDALDAYTKAEELLR